jgi:hypothetical protein
MVLRRSIEQLEPGLTIIDGDREQTVASARIDITTGSQQTLRWREMDSNFRFRARRNQAVLGPSAGGTPIGQAVPRGQCATFQLAQNDVEGREIDFFAVVGRVEPVRVYEIIAPAGCLSAAEQQLCGLFAEGLAAYRARDWDQSERCFAQCLAVMPADGPATVFHRRINLLRGKMLPADWDGVWQLTDK